MIDYRVMKGVCICDLGKPLLTLDLTSLGLMHVWMHWFATDIHPYPKLRRTRVHL